MSCRHYIHQESIHSPSHSVDRGGELPANSPSISDPESIQNSLDYRWRQLVLWLNRVAKYRIEVSELDDSSKNIKRLEPKICDEKISNLLHDIGKGVFDWDKQLGYFREGLWPELMAKILYCCPEKALDFLEVTTEKLIELRFIPQRGIAHAIHCIVKYHLQGENAHESQQVIQIAIRIYRFLLKIPSSHVLPISNYSSFLLLSNLPRIHLGEFYQYISEKYEEISIWTQMQLISRLAKAGEINLAFEAVQKLTKTHCHLNRPNTLSVFTTFLNEARINKNEQFDVSEILQYLVSFGVEPNIFLYNILIHSTLQHQKPQDAWQIYDMMIKGKIQPDTITHSILLNDAKLRLDRLAIERVINKIKESGSTSKYIVTDLIHAILLLHNDDSETRLKSPSGHLERPQPAFDRMLQVYVEYFNLEPLMQIIPGLSDAYSPNNITSNKPPPWDPPSATLCVMISGYLSLMDSHGAKLFYENFRRLIQTGNPIVGPLVRTTHVYNVILMCFYKFKERAEDAPEIIADMLSPNRKTVHQVSNTTIEDSSKINSKDSPGSSDDENASYTPHYPAKPDIYTWSILIKIFMRLRHSRAAEKVLSMMIRRGIQPEIITWTSLVSGYARLQNVSMTADAYQRLKEAGYAADDYIYRALAKVHQQSMLSKELERPRARKVKPVTSEWIEDLKSDIAVDKAEREVEMQYEDSQPW